MVKILVRILAGIIFLPSFGIAATQPFISMSADSSSLGLGGVVSISWAASGASSCEASGDWQGVRSLDGVFQSEPVTESRTHEYRLRCSSEDSWIDQVVFVEVEDQMQPSYESPWLASPTIVPHRSDFSKENVRWRVKFRLNSIGAEQALVSYDETRQDTAGHTTVSVDKSGRVVVRHQGFKKGSYLTRSNTRIKAGQDYELVLEIQKNRGLSLWLDGELEGTSDHAFGTEALKRDLILGASCAKCRKGTNAPLTNSIRGGMSLAVEAFGAESVSDQPAEVQETPAPTVEGQALFSTASISQPKVFEHQPAFARSAALWSMQIELNSLRTKQSLVSYDERYQDTAGHTTVSVLKTGIVQVRHQNDSGQSFYLNSKTQVRTNQKYDLVLRNVDGEALELFVDGVREARITQAFGTAATKRPLVVGGSCERCTEGTTSPLIDAIDGNVTLNIYADGADLPPVDVVAEAVDPVPPQQESASNSQLLYRSSVVEKPTVFDYQSAFSQARAEWIVKFKLNSVGFRQGLFSYDETGQRTSGHSTLEILGDGRIALRHQDAGKFSEVLVSKTKVRAGTEYTASVQMLKGDALALLVDGVVEDSSSRSFGTDATRRDLVVGASCAYCQVGTVAPLRHAIDGEAVLEIHSVGDTDTPEPAAEEQVAESPTVAPQPEPEETVPGTVVVAPPVEPQPVVVVPEPEPEPVQPTTLAFDASDTTVKAGDQVELSWSSENATSCSASGDWDGVMPVAGNQFVTASSENRNFTLSCSGASDSVVSIISLTVDEQFVTARWIEPSANSDGSPLTDLSGYVIYYGTASGSYPSSLQIDDPDTLSAQLTLPPETYYFTVAAVNSAGEESNYSSEVSKIVR